VSGLVLGLRGVGYWGFFLFVFVFVGFFLAFGGVFWYAFLGFPLVVGVVPRWAFWLLWGCSMASSLSRVVGFVPSLRSVLLSGRCRVAPWGGSALGLSFRRSRRSLSGFVAVVRFSALPAARLFACSWGRRLPPRPGFCAVRRVPGGFAVSVPVCPCFPPCRSGLRALVAARAVSAAPFALAA
jgi:hypothetical protein